MARTRSAGAESITAQASTPPLAPEPVNPSASAIQPSAGTGVGPSVLEVEHTASGMFEVSLEGLGASAQDIEALRRIRALITAKTVTAQQDQEMRPSSSQVQPSQQQDVAPPHATPDTVNFNIRQAERYLPLLQSQIAGTSPPQQAIPTPITPAQTPATHAAPVTTPPDIIPYYRLNHSFWSLSDNKEVSR
jgi:hypothetical protein